MLHEFLESKRSDIIAQVRVAARPAPRVTETELTEGHPLFVDHLIATLEGSALPGEMNAAATMKGLNDLIERSLAEVRLESTMRRRETILLAEFVREAELAAGIEAKVHGHELKVAMVEGGVRIDADRELLAMAVANLLKNAFKFTPVPGHIWLRTHTTADRVFIDIEDECGGLPPGQAAELVHPFDERSTDRSGLGLGLSISRKAVQAHGGDIQVRNLPGKACIFTIALPRKLGVALRASSDPS